MKKIKNKDITTYTVEEPGDLLPFLLQILHKKSRNSVKSILKRGQVKVDGHIITQHNHPLKPGQTIMILSNRASIQQAALTDVSIVYEDEEIIIINKEAGLLSMSDSTQDESDAYLQLTDYVKIAHPKNNIFIVHRLDRDTSGVMVYAKNERAKDILQENWDERVKERTYTALVEGNVEENSGTISSWLSQNKALKVYSTPYDNGGKYAVTHYKKITGNQDYSLLEIELETGRKNQIRVHLDDLGHPVVGDKKYSAATDPIHRLGLHATTLSFNHPKTNEFMRFTVDPPTSFYNLID